MSKNVAVDRLERIQLSAAQSGPFAAHQIMLDALAVKAWWMNDAGTLGYLNREWIRAHHARPVRQPDADPSVIDPHTLWHSALAPEDRPVWEHTAAKALTDQASFQVALRFRDAHGKLRLYQLNAQYAGDGWAGHSIEIARPLPKEKTGYRSDTPSSGSPASTADSILPHWINAPQDILNHTTEAFVTINSHAIITGWNPAATTTLGWAAADVIGRSIYDTVVPPRFIDQVRETLALYQKEDSHPLSQQRIDAAVLTRTRGEIRIDLTASRIQTQDGVQFSCFFHDISARRQVEHELKNTRDLLHNVMDSLPAIVAYVDAQCVYRYCNKAYLDLFSIKAEQVLGKSIQAFFSGTGYAIMKPHIDRVFRGETVSFELPVEVRGERRYFEGRYIPEFNASDVISGFYVMVWDVTERHTREIELRSMATLDTLTGVFNRATLQEHVQSSIDTHFKQHESLALLYLDIDHFKEINDTYGHPAGDEVLINFSKRLRMAVRATDMIWRIGGDEFVICLNGMTSIDIATSVANKIIELVRKPVSTPMENIRISTSIGMAYLDTEKCRQIRSTSQGISGSSVSFEHLLETADAALYEAKRSGRDCLFLKETLPDDRSDIPSITETSHSG